MKVDLIIHDAAQLATCASNGKAKKGAEMRDVGIIENGAVAINKGKIVAVGKSAEITRDFESELAIDAKNKVVSPGFVDCHTHIVYAGNRLNEFELKIKGADYLEILAGGGGILNTVAKTRAESVDNLAASGIARLEKMLGCGTTTAEIKTGYGLDAETELKMLRVISKLAQMQIVDIVPTFLAAHAVPAEFNANPDEYVELVCTEMMPRAMEFFTAQTHLTNENIPFFVDVFCEKNAFNLEQSKRILDIGKRLGFKLKAHVDEFTNLGAARMAIELGATSIDHLDATSDEEIELLANSNTVGIVTPTVNFNFGATHYADARKMIDKGCAIAVSTDYNPGSAPCPSLPNAMAIACRYQKLLPSEAFNAITVNAAHALAIGDKSGSIEVGKQADVLILDTADYREIAYEFGGNFVQTIVKCGKVIISR